MGGNGCVRVWMGAMGFRGTGGQKNKASRDINGCAGHDLVPIWPGKIPRTSCFAKKQKNMHGALRMGAHGLVWMRVDAFIRREAKMRQKEEQMGEQGVFYNVCQRSKNKKVSKGGHR